MAIAVDSVASLTGQSAGTSFSWNHTVSGSNRVLVVMFFRCQSTNAPSAVTYNGAAMTSFGSRQDNSGSGITRIYYLINPDTGTNSVSVTYASNSDILSGGSISFTGADQTTPLTNSNNAAANSDNPSVTITTTADKYVIAAMVGHCTGGGTFTGITEDQGTLISKEMQAGMFGGGAFHYIAGSGSSQVMSYALTSGGTNQWGIIGASVNPVAAASGRKLTLLGVG